LYTESLSHTPQAIKTVLIDLKLNMLYNVLYNPLYNVLYKRI